MCVRRKREDFLSKMDEQYGDLYEFPNLDYVNSLSEVLIYCARHCTYSWKKPKKILKGQCCNKCGYERVSKAKASEVSHVEDKLTHAFGEMVTLVNYTTSTDSDSQFRCNLSGEVYEYRIGLLLKRGCRCNFCQEYSRECKYWREYFKSIFRCQVAHQGKYEYDMTAGFGKSKTITAICTKHGNFYPTPFAHYSLMTNCPKCANEDRVYVGGFGDKFSYFTDKVDHGNLDGEVYLLKLETDVGDFLKVGITGKTVEERIKSMKYKSYIKNVEILARKKYTLLKCSELEKGVIDRYTDKKDFIPYQDMQGWSETFNVRHKDSALRHFDLTY